MRIVECEQGSFEWHQARAGIATSSCFDKILTPTGKFSTQSNEYANELCAEILLGYSLDDENMNTEWMERGKILEEAAADFYAMTYNVELKKVGLIISDCGFYGTSLDRLICKNGVLIGSLEIKCPKSKTHMKYLTEKKLDDKYKPQIQGQYFITDFKKNDIISYHPEMPPCVMSPERDEKYIASLAEQLDVFKQSVKEKLKILVHDGHITAEQLAERGIK